MAQDWLDSDGRFTKGKHRNEVIEDVSRDDPSYLSWVLREVEDLGEEDREVIEVHLTWRGRR